MSNKESNYLFPLFALIVLFADELFYCYLGVSGMTVETGLKAMEAIAIAGVAFFMMFSDMTKHRFSKRNYSQFFFIAVLIVLYYSTQFFIPELSGIKRYRTTLLSCGALCLPAAYVGMRLAWGKYNEQVLNLLPIFVVVVSVIVGAAVLLSSAVGKLLTSEEEVFSYQTASYYLSFCYSYCFFYAIGYKDKSKTFLGKIATFVMYGMMIVCASCCLMGGGRGAFVYMVLISAYLVYRYVLKGGKHRWRTILLFAIGAGILAIVAVKMNVFESAGFTRMSENLTTDDERTFLWERAMAAYRQSPLFGHGLGSIWATVGFYSHNMLGDLLAETGILGTTIIIVVLVRIFICLSRRSGLSGFDMFMLLVFLGALIHDTFSGYWMTSPKLFLAFGYVFGLTTTKLKKRLYRLHN